MAPSKLNVIALISGGKDSLFSILHCIANGHEVVALANLYPNDARQDSDGNQIENENDTDSYMYQTVGHSVIRLYEEALGLPLYRHPITGVAVDQSMDYDSGGGTVVEGQPETFDEAEDLYDLLQSIKDRHPEANAVSTGAILSTYQRTRVESVALRLGLTPLSYLWQYPYLPDYYEDEAKLLEDMRAVGQDSRIIKVADGRLDSSFLWKEITDKTLKRKLGANTGMFKSEVGDVLGEGGQYESMTFSGPRPLWKKAIDVEKWSRQTPSGGSAAAKPEGIKTKALPDATVQYTDKLLPRPKTFDTEFRYGFLECLKFMDSVEDESTLAHSEEPLVGGAFTGLHKMLQDMSWCMQENGNTCRISNMGAHGETAVEQMQNIKTRLADELLDRKVTTASITSTTLILRRMEDFASINPIYGSMFFNVNPPSRVTIACGDLLPGGTNVLLSITIDKIETSKRRGLHVQSRSYWAPANIGPYSQSIAISLRPINSIDPESSSSFSLAIPELVHVAGQIPLVPATMELATAEDWDDYNQDLQGLPKDSHHLSVQALLSLQHLWRLGRAMKVIAWTGAIVFIPKTDAVNAMRLAELTCGLWNATHRRAHEVAGGQALSRLQGLSLRTDNGATEESVEEPIDKATDADWDVWTERNNPYRDLAPGEQTYGKDSRSALPDFHSIAEFRSKPFPPCFAIEVEELPRGAPMEWWSYGISQGKVRYDTYRKDHFVMDKVTSIESGLTVSYIRLKDLHDLSFWNYQDEFKASAQYSDPPSMIPSRPLTTVYTTQALPLSFLDVMKPQIVPCRSILAPKQGSDHRLAALVVVVMGIHPNPSDVANLIPEKEISCTSAFRVDNSLRTMDCRPLFLWPERQYNEDDNGSPLETIDPSSR